MVEFLVNRKLHQVIIIERNRGNFVVEVNGKIVPLKIRNLSWDKTVTVEMNRRSLKARIERPQTDRLHVEIGGRIYEVKKRVKVAEGLDVRMRHVKPIVKRIDSTVSLDRNTIEAPIAGKIVLLKAKVGQKVAKGQCILVLEAMKMENEITAPRAGIVSEVRVAQGSIVNKSDVLAVIS